MNDVMLSGMTDNLNQFMTKEQMMVKAPFIFSKGATNPNVSDRYVFANTETIINDMARLGWNVVDCKQQRGNKKSNIRSLHMVAFQNEGVVIRNANNEVDCYPRIILTNSHDGFRSFKFMVGIFRTICSNGLVVATETFESITIKHINYDFDELRRVVAQSIERVREQIVVMNDMQKTTLSYEQKCEFVTKAMQIRKNDEDVHVDIDTIDSILTPIREEDNSNDLWSVFNVIQEKMIKGNFEMQSANGKKRKARAIKGLSKDIDLNTRLFKTATTYLNAA